MLTRRIPSDPICLALDVTTTEQAVKLIETTKAKFVKVGLELFCSEGPAAVRAVAETGVEIFLDLKLHDIPRTAAAATANVASLGVKWLTIHGSGGRAMITECVGAADVNILVVSVLTSLDDDALSQIGFAQGSHDQVLRIARVAEDCGAAGLICSPLELSSVRKRHSNLTLVSPGVRPQGVDAHDQKRVATPAQARLSGADAVVVGRPVHASADPAKALQDIRLEFEGALS